ncbi:MAG: hypothetical protein ABIE74_08980 [Pseudomonadota bacterium]
MAIFTSTTNPSYCFTPPSFSPLKIVKTPLEIRGGERTPTDYYLELPKGVAFCKGEGVCLPSMLIEFREKSLEKGDRSTVRNLDETFKNLQMQLYRDFFEIFKAGGYSIFGHPWLISQEELEMELADDSAFQLATPRLNIKISLTGDVENAQGVFRVGLQHSDDIVRAFLPMTLKPCSFLMSGALCIGFNVKKGIMIFKESSRDGDLTDKDNYHRYDLQYPLDNRVIRTGKIDGEFSRKDSLLYHFRDISDTRVRVCSSYITLFNDEGYNMGVSIIPSFHNLLSQGAKAVFLIESEKLRNPFFGVFFENAGELDLLNSINSISLGAKLIFQSGSDLVLSSSEGDEIVTAKGLRRMFISEEENAILSIIRL